MLYFFYLLVVVLSSYDLRTRSPGSPLLLLLARPLPNANRPNKDGSELPLRLFFFQGRRSINFWASQWHPEMRNYRRSLIGPFHSFYFWASFWLTSYSTLECFSYFPNQEFLSIRISARSDFLYQFLAKMASFAASLRICNQHSTYLQMLYNGLHSTEAMELDTILLQHTPSKHLPSYF